MNGLTLLVCCLMAYQKAIQVGPANGSLLLVGGGVTRVWDKNLFYFLRAGDRYDMTERRVVER